MADLDLFWVNDYLNNHKSETYCREMHSYLYKMNVLSKESVSLIIQAYF